MEHIVITNQNSNVEIVNSNIISKLAEEAQDCDATSNMTGNLQTTTAYEDDVDFLTTKFPGLNINATQGLYARLLDPELAVTFATKWGDGVGVTSLQLSTANANADDINEIISNSTSIKDMRDFKKVGCVTSNYTFGYYNGKCKSVVHGYIPKIYNEVSTGDYNSAFGSSLQDIEFADNVIRLGAYAFQNCSNLLLDKIPDTVTDLGRATFKNCSKITVDSTNNVEFIGKETFYGCTSITSFTIKAKCEINGGSVFWGCSNLESIIFEQGSGPNIEFSDEGGWEDGFICGTKVTTLDIPERVTYFGNASMNCSTLRTLIIRKTTVPNKGSWKLNNNVQIYVPDASVQLYKDAWTDVTSRIHGISELPSND
jgi:hypothetical protein